MRNRRSDPALSRQTALLDSFMREGYTTVPGLQRYSNSIQSSGATHPGPEGRSEPQIGAGMKWFTVQPHSADLRLTSESWKRSAKGWARTAWTRAFPEA